MKIINEAIQTLIQSNIAIPSSVNTKLLNLIGNYKIIKTNKK